MTNERLIGSSLAHVKGQETVYKALTYAQWPRNAREMVLVFHSNGLSTVSATLIAPGSRLVGFGPCNEPVHRIETVHIPSLLVVTSCFLHDGLEIAMHYPHRVSSTPET